MTSILQDRSTSIVEVFKEPTEAATKQLHIFWLPDEIKVEKDIQSIKVDMTEAERHGVITTLKLFSMYEMKAGTEYWGNRYRQIFKGPEFERVASVFSMFELAVHKPFYQKINELLALDEDSFYDSYVNDPILKSRMDFIDEIVDNEDDAVSLGGFSMVEGVILYSSFSYLKHFQSKGKNKLLNVVRGINFSVRDENLHSEYGAWSFKKYIEAKGYSDEQKNAIYEKLISLAHKLYEHECRIIDMIFEKGEISGITSVQMKHFVQSRINLVLKQLGIEKIFDVTYNPISDWFYDGINGYQFNDFFSGIGNQYNRNWDESGFAWVPQQKAA